MRPLGQWPVLQHCYRNLHLTWSRKCMVEQLDYFHYLTKLPHKNVSVSFNCSKWLTEISAGLFDFFSQQNFLTKKPAADTLHRNGWGFFKHTIEIYLYLQIQMFLLIFWTKSTPKEVPSLHQTFHFAGKLMTHLRFSPLEKILPLTLLSSWANQNKILSELCKRAAGRLLRNCCRVREEGSST